MNLFIFNFDIKLLKSLIIALVLFLIFSTFLETYDPEVNTYQNQMIKNYSVAEKYIYSKNKAKIVIVGSSMSNRLSKDELDHKVYNMSFAGGSVLTGLNIIKSSNELPKIIFVETNIIERMNNKDMLDSLFVPLVWQIKGSVKSLQCNYQPINILLSMVKTKFGHKKAYHINRLPNKKILESALLRLKGEAKKYKHLIDNKELEEVKILVEYFEKNGTKIVFYQMPVDKSVLTSEQYKFRQKTLLKMFPKMKFYWIKNKGFNYLTSDGIHLMEKSAIRFTQILNQIIAAESM